MIRWVGARWVGALQTPLHYEPSKTKKKKHKNKNKQRKNTKKRVRWGGGEKGKLKRGKSKGETQSRNSKGQTQKGKFEGPTPRGQLQEKNWKFQSENSKRKLKKGNSKRKLERGNPNKPSKTKKYQNNKPLKERFGEVRRPFAAHHLTLNLPTRRPSAPYELHVEFLWKCRQASCNGI